MFMRLLLIGLVALSSVSAATLSSVQSGTNLVSLLQKSVAINQVTVANATTNVMTVRLYDAPTNLVTWVQPQYTNTVITVGLTTNTLVNIIGRTNTTVYRSMSVANNTVSAVTNDYRQVIVLTIPASGTSTFAPSNPVLAIHGLLLSNTQAGTVTIDYVPFD